jgi:hypothetical protein
MERHAASYLGGGRHLQLPFFFLSDDMDRMECCPSSVTQFLPVLEQQDAWPNLALIKENKSEYHCLYKFTQGMEGVR